MVSIILTRHSSIAAAYSEIAVRKAVVDRYPRDSYVLTTKLSNEFMRSKEEQEETFRQQLEKLGVEYVDYYLLTTREP